MTPLESLINYTPEHRANLRARGQDNGNTSSLAPCVQCGAKVSEIQLSWGTEPVGFFLDSDGLRHFHNPNNRGRKFRCASGHELSVPGYSCWCHWKPDNALKEGV